MVGPLPLRGATCTEEDTHMADRGLTASIPIWVRVPGIIALVLVGVVVSSMLLGGSSSGGRGMGGMGSSGGHGRGDQMQQQMQQGGSSSGSHGCGAQMQQMDHNGGQTGPATPSVSEPAKYPAPSGDQTPPNEGGPSGRPDEPTPTPSHGSGDHTRSDGSRGH